MSVVEAKTMPSASNIGALNAQCYLVLEQTSSGDEVARLSVYVDNDGPSVLLAADQLRDLAADLLQRALVLDPGSKHVHYLGVVEDVDRGGEQT